MVTQLGYDQQSYPAQIQAKIAELQEFVHINLSKAACSQKPQYDQHTTQPAFIVGSPVSLQQGNLILDGKETGLLNLWKVLLRQKFVIEMYHPVRIVLQDAVNSCKILQDYKNSF